MVLIVRDARLRSVLPSAQRRLQEAGVRTVSMAPDEFCLGGSDAHARAPVALVGVNFAFSREVMTKLPRLKAIVSAVSGTDTIDKQAARALGIRVGHSPAADTSESIAEATVLLMLNLLYQLPRNEALLRTGEAVPDEPLGQMLKGKTIGLVGFGRSARALCSRLQPWQVRIRAYSRARDAGGIANVEFVSLEELLASSDIVSVHASLREDTRDLLSAAQLAKMKRGAYLINMARGAIVDETALCALAERGHLAGIALDVFRAEPLAADSPLRRLSNAILTPHTISHTAESFEGMTRLAVANVLNALEGRPLEREAGA